MNAHVQNILSYLSSYAPSVSAGVKDIGNAISDGAKSYGRFVKAYYLFLPSLIIASATGGDGSETHKKFLRLIGERAVEKTTDTTSS